MDQFILNLSKYGMTLSTRDLGREIRLEVFQKIKENIFVIINFDGVELISSGFSDELFGKLSQELSSEEMKNKLSIKFPQDVKKALLIQKLVIKAILDRKDMFKTELA